MPVMAPISRWSARSCKAWSACRRSRSRQDRIGNPIQGCEPVRRLDDRHRRPLQGRVEVDPLPRTGREPECRAAIDVEHDVGGRPSGLQAGIEYPGLADAVEPGAFRDEGRLMNMARDHHRWMVTLDPLQQFDIAEKALTAPAGRRVRGRRMMHPDPSLRPRRGCLAQLEVDARLRQRSVPPGTDGKERIADREIVAVAGNAERADVVDPARDLLTFGVALIEVVIAGAENDAGHAGETRKGS